jgi:hypothetical protein
MRPDPREILHGRGESFGSGFFVRVHSGIVKQIVFGPKAQSFSQPWATPRESRSNIT